MVCIHHVVAMQCNWLTVSQDSVKFRYDFAKRGAHQVGRNGCPPRTANRDVGLEPNACYLPRKKDIL